MTKEFGTLVFIGRFQPFHFGHKHVIDAALEKAERVIILVGSADESRTQRNPWTFQERYGMIKHSLPEVENHRLIITPIADYKYNENEWIEAVCRSVRAILITHPQTINQNVGLAGYGKDGTSYYLKLFPQWDSVNIDPKDNKFKSVLSSTEIRQEYFDRSVSSANYLQFMPANVVDDLQCFRLSNDYKKIADEYEFVKKYKKMWEAAPYPVTFTTVDSVVVQSGHVLLVTRKEHPGKGKWALPGGFVNQDEYLLEAALRELREETRIKYNFNVIKDKLVNSKVFDDPHRSARGRTITHAFLFHLDPATRLPQVKGGDDAKSAFWVPIADLQPDVLFEDHYHIIKNLTAIL